MTGITVLSTPDGPFTLIAEEDCIIGAGWCQGPQRLLPNIHPSLRPTRFDDHPSYLLWASELVLAYYDGDLNAPAAAKVSQRSGPFRELVWQELSKVPPGTLLSYAELAELAGRPRAIRAAATACSRNAVALFVPCHRVIHADGNRGGFAYDDSIKLSLIARELERN